MGVRRVKMDKIDDTVYITITKKLHDDLVKSDRELNALYAHGVDNWEGFGGAMEELYPEEDEDDVE